MALSRYQIQKIKSDLVLIICSGFLGGAFALIMTVAVSGVFNIIQCRPYLLLGTLTGLGISFGSVLLQMEFDRHGPRPLWVDFLVMPLAQTGLIVVIYGLFFIIIFGLENFLTNSWIVQTLVISYTLTAISNFIDNLNRLLGKNVLRGLIVGTYRKPVKECRFVMFLDIAGSTTIAEKLGDIKFHAFLNDFFCDIARPIVNCQGEIYKYVGDEVIITWKERAGKKNHAALRVFSEIDGVISARAEHYRARYGIIPEYRAGLHFGPLVAGEMGLNKQEIAFSGDVMNTTARIQAECRNLGERFLVSDSALALLCPEGSTNPPLSISSRGTAALRGKAQEIGISAIR